MTTLSKNSPRRYEPVGTDISDLPVVASDIIYEGAAVGDNGSGYARPLQAGDPFRGFCLQEADNASGGNGDINARIRHRGYIQLPISGLAITDVGKDVYASDDDTFTLTEGSNTRIGSVHRWVSSGVGIVKFRAADGLEAELTDNTAGTAGDTIADLADGTTYANDHAAIENNFASLTAKVNNILRRLGN